MSDLNFQSFNVMLPYAVDDASSIANLKTLANFIGTTIPGLYWDESLATENSYFYHQEFICSEATGKPVLAVHNYNYSGTRCWRGIGYCLVNSSKGLINTLNSNTSNQENAWGRYWYPYSGSSDLRIYIHLLDSIDGITLFDITSGTTAKYDMFITTIMPEGNTTPTDPTIFKYYDGNIGWSTADITGIVGSTVGQYLPSNLEAYNKFYYLDKVYIMKMGHYINHIKAFSGLSEVNTQYQIIEADYNRYMTIGLRTADKWQPIVPLS